ncbi:MAG: hypothetical protein LBG47_03995 [Prevotellaceae bacterium]|nr:hypothetical protein [Prevotellaceae bacterium]
MLRSSVAPLTGGETRGGMGFGVGAGYAYHLNQQMSLRTGLEVNSYNGTSYVNNIQELSTVNIPSAAWSWKGDNWFQLNAQITNYTVQQSAVYLHVPLLFGYEDALPWVDWITWYSCGGAKLGYSLSGRSTSKADLSLLADFEGTAFDYTIKGDNTEGGKVLKDWLGWGDFAGHADRSALNLGFSSVAYLEAGLKQKLAQQYSLYVGIFGEYSLYSSIAGSVSQQMYEYKPLEVADEYNRFYHLQYTPASHTTSNRSRTFYPMSFGITLRVSFDTRRPEPSNNRMLQMRYLDF